MATKCCEQRLKTRCQNKKNINLVYVKEYFACRVNGKHPVMENSNLFNLMHSVSHLSHCMSFCFPNSNEYWLIKLIEHLPTEKN